MFRGNAQISSGVYYKLGVMEIGKMEHFEGSELMSLGLFDRNEVRTNEKTSKYHRATVLIVILLQ